jgi:hypothetical protein
MSPVWTGVVLPATVSGHEHEGTEVGPSLKSLRSAKPAVASIATPIAVVIAIFRVRRNVMPADKWIPVSEDTGGSRLLRLPGVRTQNRRPRRLSGRPSDCWSAGSQTYSRIGCKPDQQPPDNDGSCQTYPAQHQPCGGVGRGLPVGALCLAARDHAEDDRQQRADADQPQQAKEHGRGSETAVDGWSPWHGLTCRMSQIRSSTRRPAWPA